MTLKLRSISSTPSQREYFVEGHPAHNNSSNNDTIQISLLPFRRNVINIFISFLLGVYWLAGNGLGNWFTGWGWDWLTCWWGHWLTGWRNWLASDWLSG